MRLLPKTLPALTALCTSLLLGGPARPAPPPAGHAPTLARNQAVVLSGAAQWRPRNRPASPLRPGRPQPFSPGDIVRCGPHSRLRMRLAGSPFPVDNTDSTWQDWPIPFLAAGGSGPGLYLPTLGRTRGPLVPRTLPDPVDPRTFVIFWPVPMEGRGPLSLRLVAPDGEKLWAQAGVDAATGCLFSSGARRALADYQASGGAGPVTLTMLRNGRPFPPVRFTLRPPP